jgi:hypothetical protein
MTNVDEQYGHVAPAVGWSGGEAPLSGGDDVEEFRELVDSVSPTHGRERVVGKVIDVAAIAVAGAGEGSDVAPRGLDGVCMSARTLIDEAYAMVHGTVRVIL